MSVSLRRNDRADPRGLNPSSSSPKVVPEGVGHPVACDRCASRAFQNAARPEARDSPRVRGGARKLGERKKRGDDGGRSRIERRSQPKLQRRGKAKWIRSANTVERITITFDKDSFSKSKETFAGGWPRGSTLMVGIITSIVQSFPSSCSLITLKSHLFTHPRSQRHNRLGALLDLSVI
jgi:hypothetical protein